MQHSLNPLANLIALLIQRSNLGLGFFLLAPSSFHLALRSLNLILSSLSLALHLFCLTLNRCNLVLCSGNLILCSLCLCCKLLTQRRNLGFGHSARLALPLYN